MPVGRVPGGIWSSLSRPNQARHLTRRHNSFLDFVAPRCRRAAEGGRSARRRDRMDDAPEDRRAAALAANEAGRFAEAWRLWLPLADAGDPEAQGHVGSLMAYSLHRFESVEQLNAGTGPKLDEAA